MIIIFVNFALLTSISLVIGNFKMARHLTKYRRFILDTNYVDPSAGVSPGLANSMGMASQRGANNPSSGVNNNSA